MKTSALIVLSSLCLAANADDSTSHPSQNYLWYKQPAIVRPIALPWTKEAGNTGNLPGKQTKDAWESQTLPVGNGRIGGTIFGGDKLEHVNLNEVSLWSGGPNLPNNGSGYVYGPTANKDTFGSYQPFGSLYISFDNKGDTENYSRSLDLRDGIARVRYTQNGAKYQRECFVSEPDDVLVYSASTDSKEGLKAHITLTPNHTVIINGEKKTITPEVTGEKPAKKKAKGKTKSKKKS